jgi:asparagine synthase (glutamine-hydrolysing)
MCGIAGAVVSPGCSIDPQRLEAMTAVIAHRGPDGAGLWIAPDGRVGLGHRRLSIIDLSPAGAQPMVSRSGRYVVTFNGEIYNCTVLRAELEAAGESFRGHSDTEVMVAAFERWGVVATLPRLSGMFAIGVWDAVDETLWLARDRAGIKPLYYSAGHDGLVFASELRPLVLWRGTVPAISAEALAEYLRLGYVPGPLSIFEGIFKLPPGCLLGYRLGELQAPQQYWSLTEVVRSGRADTITDEAEAIDALDATLSAAVRSHMMADVPLGAFLSGGIDSSTVVALMQRQSGQAINTYSIGFHEQGYDEARHAAAVAHHLGTQHTELYVTDADARSVIPLLPDIYDEPFADASQIPTLLVSRLARTQVTVALSGDGGDELFGGYNRYVFVARFWQRLQRLPLPLRRLMAGVLSTPAPGAWDMLFRWLGCVLPNRLVPALPAQKMARVASILPAQSLLALHARLVAQWPEPAALLAPRWVHDHPHWGGRLEAADGLESAELQMLWDAESYLVDDILTKVDRATMRVGLEARVPLLDHSVIELAWRIPQRMKIRDGQGKWLLRQVLYRDVPAAMMDRPKMGFSVPVAAWLRGPLRAWAEPLLEPDRLKREGHFNPDVVRQTWTRHQEGRVDASGPLWTVLMFQLWHERLQSWL